MATRLYCRECGWHPKFRRKRAAFRAAGRHHGTGIPVAKTCPPWRSRLWTNLCTSSSASSAADADVDERTFHRAQPGRTAEGGDRDLSA